MCVFLCRNSCYGKHLANGIPSTWIPKAGIFCFFSRKSFAVLDWLVGCWLLFIGTLLGCVCGAALLAYYSYHGMAREIFDWYTDIHACICYALSINFIDQYRSTGLFDLVLFLIGTMYVLAGAYEEESEQCTTLFFIIQYNM